MLLLCLAINLLIIAVVEFRAAVLAVVSLVVLFFAVHVDVFLLMGKIFLLSLLLCCCCCYIFFKYFEIFKI